MERYSHIYKLPQELYTEGCPVIIKAGALLMDNTLNKVLAQLKFKNLQKKKIKEVMVSVKAYDAAGTELKGVQGFIYRNLDAAADAEFGQQVPVDLPDLKTENFSALVEKVVFADDTIWEAVAAAASVEITEEQQALILEKNCKKAKKLAILPLILAVAAIILEFIRMYTYWKTYDFYVERDIPFSEYLLGSSKTLVGMIFALILPIVVIIATKIIKKKTSLKVFSLAYYAIALLQVVCAIVVLIGLLGEIPTDVPLGEIFRFTKLYGYISSVKGSHLLNSVYQIFNGGASVSIISWMISSIFYIAKNVVGGIVFARMAKSK